MGLATIPKITEIDKISLLVTCPSDMTLEALEKELRREGYSLRYRPKTSLKNLRLKKILEDRIPNRQPQLALADSPESSQSIEDLCIALKVRTRYGVMVTKNVPRSATGPDFKKIFIGSKGMYGEILEATLKIYPAP